MVTRVKNASTATAMHTSGLYSDMSLDGPEIGTLVVIFDRARNLPNRRSMGKQDPYCAARLGKEAKRTATDMRGGQTPRWDQEIRFTVHESPDYFKLKISVFNDDRKTELVGEGWVQLDDVIVPGGGRADLWHTLHCRGKYAGEIRLELTYYDSRPKVEQLPEPHRESAKSASPGVAGPRQTPVKRRPLPADPSSASPSPRGGGGGGGGGQRPLPLPQPQVAGRETQTPPRQQQQQQYSNEHTPSSNRRTAYNQQQPRPVDPRREPHSADMSYDRYNDQFAVQPLEALSHQSSDPFDLSLNPPRHNGQYRPPQVEHVPEPLPYPSEDEPPTFHADPRGFRNAEDFRQHSPNPPAPLAHSNSEPTLHGHEQHLQRLERAAIHHASSDSTVYSMHQEPSHMHHAPPGSIYEEPDHLHAYVPDHVSVYDTPSRQPYVEDEDGPPPPPMHRASAPSSVSHPRNTFVVEEQDLIIAPLSFTPSRRPLPSENSEHERFQVHDGYTQSSPAIPHMYEDPNDPPNRRWSEYGRPQHYEFNDASASIPQSHHEPLEWQRRSLPHQRTSILHPAQPSFDHPYATPPRRDTHPLAQQETASYDPEPSQPLHISPADAPPPIVVKPRAISPHVKPSQYETPVRKPVQTITRKSVSPRPDSGTTAFSSPFSPDSFDELNPNARKSTSSLVNSKPDSADRYYTPNESRGSDGLKYEQTIRESPYNQQDRDDEDPIRDAFGNVVDPSDHLPVNSWAPEPERKGFSFKPQIVPREREKLNGARSLGSSPATAGGSSYAGSVAGSVATSTTTSRLSITSQEPVSLGSSLVATVGNSRNKLHKRNPRPQSMVVGASSAASAGTVLHGPGAQAGAGNYPYVNASSSHSHSHSHSHSSQYALAKRSSYAYGTATSAGPPPIPAKIPLDHANGRGDGIGERDGDYPMDKFSEEMSRIDIGPGPAGSSALAKRPRRGFGFGFN